MIIHAYSTEPEPQQRIPIHLQYHSCTHVNFHHQIPGTTAPWGIISVKGQLCDYELPMQPITVMRNALGKEYGGSGVPLDFDKYKQSVDFWMKYVALK